MSEQNENMKETRNSYKENKKERKIAAWNLPIIIFAAMAAVAAIVVAVIAINNTKALKEYKEQMAHISTTQEDTTDEQVTLETAPDSSEDEQTTPIPTTSEDTEMASESEGVMDDTETVAKPTEDKGSKDDNSNKRGQLSIKGTQLVDQNGKAIQLKGVSTHGLQWFGEYVNKNAFKTLRDNWGANLIRLALYTHEGGGYCSGGNKAALEQKIEDGVNYATELGMYVIIDWHVLNEKNPKIYQKEAEEFWNKISKKYAGNNNVLYEICNEPNGTTWSDIKSYADTIIPIIRKNDKNAIIIVGTECWSQLQNLDSMISNPLSCDTKNVMYTCHFYAATHGDNIRNNVKQALSKGLPVFISEFSICDASGNGGIDYNSADAWKKLINDNNLSYAGWSLCNKAETSALISSGCSKLSGWSESELSETGKWLRKMILNGRSAKDPIEETTESGGGNNDPTNPTNPTNPTDATEENPDEFKVTQKSATKKCTFTFSLESSWKEGGCFCYVVQAYVKNDGSDTLNNWDITLNIPKSCTVRDGAWGCSATVSGSTVKIKGADYSLNLAAGASQNFGFILMSPNPLVF